MKKWIIRPIGKIPKQFERFKLNSVTAQLLWARNINSPQEVEQFFSGRYDDLESPEKISGIKKAVERIAKSIEKNEKVVIFGDYDADGLTSSALLKEVLDKVGIDAPVYIPDRNKEGYGLNKIAIDFIEKEYKPNLIITVDCGISNWEEVGYIQKKGIDIVITDHHSIPKKKPTGCIVINPKLEKEKSAARDLAGVGVAFKLCQAIFEKLLPKNVEHLKWFLDLVAIGTIADCVPLIGENRILVKFGLIVLQKTKRIGLIEIIKTARLNIGEHKPPNTENVSFQIGPRLNASGRMDHADLTLNLLLEKDPAHARVLALEVESKNSERQKVSQQVYTEIKKTLDEKKEYKLIVRSGKHWPQGIVGVVAGRICDEFNCPVFLLKENKDIFEGSGRSIENFNIVEAVSKIDKYVEKYGGHAQAMGIKIKPKNVQVFERELLKLIERDFDEEKWGKKLLIDAEIEPTMIDWDLLAEIKRFEPFGEGNREPVFMSKNLRLLDIKVVGNGQKHLKFIFQIGGAKMVEGIFWKSGERFSEFQAGDMLTVVYNLRSNEWNGSRKLELHIIDVKK